MKFLAFIATIACLIFSPLASAQLLPHIKSVNPNPVCTPLHDTKINLLKKMLLTVVFYWGIEKNGSCQVMNAFDEWKGELDPWDGVYFTLYKENFELITGKKAEPGMCFREKYIPPYGNPIWVDYVLIPYEPWGVIGQPYETDMTLG